MFYKCVKADWTTKTHSVSESRTIFEHVQFLLRNAYVIKGGKNINGKFIYLLAQFVFSAHALFHVFQVEDFPPLSTPP